MRLKKSLGQHLLQDPEICRRIAEALPDREDYARVIEIGPGRGALTQFLLEGQPDNLYLIELDRRFAAELRQKYPWMAERVVEADVLRWDWAAGCPKPTAIIGNFPYNISSQILFRVLDQRATVDTVVCMFQSEVADRIASKHGNKSFGVLSVLVQTYYEVEQLFHLPASAFLPPPKVNSTVIRLRRNAREEVTGGYNSLRRVVKLAFLHRRKKMSNTLGKQYDWPEGASQVDAMMELRPEQISVADFLYLNDNLVLRE